MTDLALSLDLGMLCRCCDYSSYELPEVEGLSDTQRKFIEAICKSCLDNMKPAVNS